MPDIKELERISAAARDEFNAVASRPDVGKVEYDQARDAYVTAMRAHHEALEASWRQQS